MTLDWTKLTENQTPVVGMSPHQQLVFITLQNVFVYQRPLYIACVFGETKGQF